MKKALPFLGASVAIMLLVTGCESDNASSRIQEKSAVYATLKPWQKKNIDKGIVAMGFTPDMVYMAIGNPNAKQSGGEREIWTYKHYYPTVDANQVKYTFNTESHYANSANLAPGMPGSLAKAGQSLSSFQTGGPQGGSIEPADMVSYILWITFEKGVVTKLKLEQNP